MDKGETVTGRSLFLIDSVGVRCLLMGHEADVLEWPDDFPLIGQAGSGRTTVEVTRLTQKQSRPDGVYWSVVGHRDTETASTAPEEPPLFVKQRLPI
jgi:hypothetical protein